MQTINAESQPWFLIYGGRYPGKEPCFYDPADFPWVKTLEENWSVMREEILALLERRQERLKPYFNKVMAFPPKHWKTLGFYFWKYKNHANCLACPETTRILEGIPNMTAGSLSVLEPGSNINPHQGDTNAIIRVHLGLSIPAPLPACGFQVGKEIREWKEGKALLFCDAHTHTAWNQTKERRLVLIVDVMRSEFADRSDAICSHVLGATFLQLVYQRLSWLNRAPGWIKYVIHFFSRGVVRVILPIQRRAGFLFSSSR
jgi:hypothetical protein